MKALTPRESRLIALALTVGLIALLIFGVGAPILAGFQARADERAALRLAYGRDSRLLATLPAWRAELARQRRTARAFSLQATNHADAETQFGRLAAEDFAAEGATPIVLNALPNAHRDQVALRADASLTYRQLVSLLRRLENQDPRVTVDYLSITASEAGKPAQAGAMDVRLDISAAFTEAGRDAR
jgi:hypothetical protein